MRYNWNTPKAKDGQCVSARL